MEKELRSPKQNHLTSREQPKSAPRLRLQMRQGGTLGFFNINSIAKDQKIEGGPLRYIRKFSKQNFTVQKKVKEGISSVVRFCMLR